MKYARLFFLLLLLAAWLARPHPVVACTPPAGGLSTYTLDEYVAAAPIVLVGTVESVTTEDYDDVATIAVETYYKGRGPAQIVVGNFGPGSVCLSGVTAGQRAIFFVRTADDGGFRAFYLSQFDATKAASPENLAALTAVVPPEQIVPVDSAPPAADAGDAAIPPTPALPSGTLAAPRSIVVIAIVAAVLLFVLFLGLLLVILLRQR